MNIKTKYDIGDKVFTVQSCPVEKCKCCGALKNMETIVTGVISSINAWAERKYSNSGGSLGVSSDVAYTIEISGLLYECFEHNVYKTEKAATAKLHSVQTARELVEGKVKKGGVNSRPTVFPTTSPKGQGGK